MRGPTCTDAIIEKGVNQTKERLGESEALHVALPFGLRDRLESYLPSVGNRTAKDEDARSLNQQEGWVGGARFVIRPAQQPQIAHFVVNLCRLGESPGGKQTLGEEMAGNDAQLDIQLVQHRAATPDEFEVVDSRVVTGPHRSRAREHAHRAGENQ